MQNFQCKTRRKTKILDKSLKDKDEIHINLNLRFHAYFRPKFIDGLILINCDISSAGWSEWAYSKLNLKVRIVLINFA